MPVVQRNISGSPVLVPNDIEGAVQDAIESVSPFLVDTKKTSKPAHKKLIRRGNREYSQPLRFAVQLFSVALNLWIGVQFYLWVRWAESGGRALEVSRPAGVEGWLPIEGLMQSKYFLFTGQVPTRSCRRVLPVRLIPYYFLRLSQVVLQLDMSGGDRLRIPMEVRPLHLPPEFPVAALG